MTKPYRKDLSHLKWDEVFARQRLRAELVDDWFAAMEIEPGATVLDVGAGPGYVSLLLADSVGSEGLVYALDRSAEALAYLEDLQRERGIGNIHCVVADATTWAPQGDRFDAALVTMVLHHVDDPARMIANLASILPAGAPLVIGEFHPDGPCEVGPPRDARIAPELFRQWGEAAGFELIEYRRQTPEHFMLAFRRRA